jgi:hypothetical protein
MKSLQGFFLLQVFFTGSSTGKMDGMGWMGGWEDFSACLLSFGVLGLMRGFC